MNGQHSLPRHSHIPIRIIFVLLMLICILVFPASQIRAVAIKPSLWAPNGPVNALAVANNTIYLGGLFNQVGPVTGSFVAIDETNGSASKSFPRVDGAIRAIASDGSGGWYIGGGFSSVDDVPRKNLAHIKADKSLDMVWDPGADNPGLSEDLVIAIGVQGSTVYIGGLFSQVGGQPRNYLAAVDATSGNVRDWNPNPDYGISALLVSNNLVYVSGNFNSIGGQSRVRLAALDATTGAVTAWNPDTNGFVNQFAVSGSTIYVGGFFTSIGGQSRKNIAALDPITGNATAWNPDVNGGVDALLISGATVYIGGSFTMIGDQSREHLAALDISSGAATSWNPGVSGSTISYLNPTVTTLGINGNTIYVGGNFTTISNQRRNNLAAVDSITGVATAWDPKAGGWVTELAVSSGVVYVGGTFTIVGGVMRDNLAAIDATSGMATDWNPGASGPNDGFDIINVLKVRDMMVYAGGRFTNIGGQSRTGLAALTTTTGAATPWNPAPDGLVTTLEISGTTAFVGGQFTAIGSQSRNNLAAIDTTTGIANDWNPNPNGYISALTLDGNTVYAGGAFTGILPSIGGQPRDYLAAIDTTTGSALPWNPNNPTAYPTIGGIGALLVTGSTVYVGSEQGVYAVDNAAGARLSSWNPPNLGGSVVSLAASETTLFVGGGNISSSGAERRYLVALNPTNGAVSTPVPEPDFTVEALALQDNMLYVGGGFFSLSGKMPAFFAGLVLSESMPIITNPEVGNIRNTSASLHGVVNANGSTTTVEFQITTTSGDYTNARSVAATPNTLSGFAPTPVVATITELTPTTTYYYRVVATSSAGTEMSGERSFTTNHTTLFMPTTVR